MENPDTQCLSLGKILHETCILKAIKILPNSSF